MDPEDQLLGDLAELSTRLAKIGRERRANASASFATAGVPPVPPRSGERRTPSLPPLSRPIWNGNSDDSWGSNTNRMHMSNSHYDSPYAAGKSFDKHSMHDDRHTFSTEYSTPHDYSSLSPLQHSFPSTPMRGRVSLNTPLHSGSGIPTRDTHAPEGFRSSKRRELSTPPPRGSSASAAREAFVVPPAGAKERRNNDPTSSHAGRGAVRSSSSGPTRSSSMKGASSSSTGGLQVRDTRSTILRRQSKMEAADEKKPPVGSRKTLYRTLQEQQEADRRRSVGRVKPLGDGEEKKTTQKHEAGKDSGKSSVASSKKDTTLNLSTSVDLKKQKRAKMDRDSKELDISTDSYLSAQSATTLESDRKSNKKKKRKAPETAIVKAVLAALMKSSEDKEDDVTENSTQKERNKNAQKRKDSAKQKSASHNETVVRAMKRGLLAQANRGMGSNLDSSGAAETTDSEFDSDIEMEVSLAPRSTAASSGPTPSKGVVSKQSSPTAKKGAKGQPSSAARAQAVASRPPLAAATPGNAPRTQPLFLAAQPSPLLRSAMGTTDYQESSSGTDSDGDADVDVDASMETAVVELTKAEVTRVLNASGFQSVDANKSIQGTSAFAPVVQRGVTLYQDFNDDSGSDTTEATHSTVSTLDSFAEKKMQSSRLRTLKDLANSAQSGPRANVLGRLMSPSTMIAATAGGRKPTQSRTGKRLLAHGGNDSNDESDNDSMGTSSDNSEDDLESFVLQRRMLTQGNSLLEFHRNKQVNKPQQQLLEATLRGLRPNTPSHAESQGSATQSNAPDAADAMIRRRQVRSLSPSTPSMPSSTLQQQQLSASAQDAGAISVQKGLLRGALASKLQSVHGAGAALRSPQSPSRAMAEKSLFELKSDMENVKSMLAKLVDQIQTQATVQSHGQETQQVSPGNSVKPGSPLSPSKLSTEATAALQLQIKDLKQQMATLQQQLLAQSVAQAGAAINNASLPMSPADAPFYPSMSSLLAKKSEKVVITRQSDADDKEAYDVLPPPDSLSKFSQEHGLMLHSPILSPREHDATFLTSASPFDCVDKRKPRAFDSASDDMESSPSPTDAHKDPTVVYKRLKTILSPNEYNENTRSKLISPADRPSVSALSAAASAPSTSTAITSRTLQQSLVSPLSNYTSPTAVSELADALQFTHDLSHSPVLANRSEIANASMATVANSRDNALTVSALHVPTTEDEIPPVPLPVLLQKPLVEITGTIFTTVADFVGNPEEYQIDFSAGERFVVTHKLPSGWWYAYRYDTPSGIQAVLQNALQTIESLASDNENAIEVLEALVPTLETMPAHGYVPGSYLDFVGETFSGTPELCQQQYTYLQAVVELLEVAYQRKSEAARKAKEIQEIVDAHNAIAASRDQYSKVHSPLKSALVNVPELGAALKAGYHTTAKKEQAVQVTVETEKDTQHLSSRFDLPLQGHESNTTKQVGAGKVPSSNSSVHSVSSVPSAQAMYSKYTLAQTASLAQTGHGTSDTTALVSVDNALRNALSKHLALSKTEKLNELASALPLSQRLSLPTQDSYTYTHAQPRNGDPEKVPSSNNNGVVTLSTLDTSKNASIELRCLRKSFEELREATIEMEKVFHAVKSPEMTFKHIRQKYEKEFEIGKSLASTFNAVEGNPLTKSELDVNPTIKRSTSPPPPPPPPTSDAASSATIKPTVALSNSMQYVIDSGIANALSLPQPPNSPLPTLNSGVFDRAKYSPIPIFKPWSNSSRNGQRDSESADSSSETHDTPVMRSNTIVDAAVPETTVNTHRLEGISAAMSKLQSMTNALRFFSPVPPPSRKSAFDNSSKLNTTSDGNAKVEEVEKALEDSILYQTFDGTGTPIGQRTPTKEIATAASLPRSESVFYPIPPPPRSEKRSEKRSTSPNVQSTGAGAVGMHKALQDTVRRLGSKQRENDDNDDNDTLGYNEDGTNASVRTADIYAPFDGHDSDGDDNSTLADTVVGIYADDDVFDDDEGEVRNEKGELLSPSAFKTSLFSASPRTTEASQSRGVLERSTVAANQLQSSGGTPILRMGEAGHAQSYGSNSAAAAPTSSGASAESAHITTPKNPYSHLQQPLHPMSASHMQPIPQQAQVYTYLRSPDKYDGNGPSNAPLTDNHDTSRASSVNSLSGDQMENHQMFYSSLPVDSQSAKIRPAVNNSAPQSASRSGQGQRVANAQSNVSSTLAKYMQSLQHYNQGSYISPLISSNVQPPEQLSVPTSIHSALITTSAAPQASQGSNTQSAPLIPALDELPVPVIPSHLNTSSSIPNNPQSTSGSSIPTANMTPRSHTTSGMSDSYTMQSDFRKSQGLMASTASQSAPVNNSFSSNQLSSSGGFHATSSNVRNVGMTQASVDSWKTANSHISLHSDVNTSMHSQSYPSNNASSNNLLSKNIPRQSSMDRSGAQAAFYSSTTQYDSAASQYPAHSTRSHTNTPDLLPMQSSGHRDHASSSSTPQSMQNMQSGTTSQSTTAGLGHPYPPSNATFNPNAMPERRTFTPVPTAHTPQYSQQQFKPQPYHPPEQTSQQQPAIPHLNDLAAVPVRPPTFASGVNGPEGQERRPARGLSALRRQLSENPGQLPSFYQ